VVVVSLTSADRRQSGEHDVGVPWRPGVLIGVPAPGQGSLVRNAAGVGASPDSKLSSRVGRRGRSAPAVP
jgi:hypothetical protein